MNRRRVYLVVAALLLSALGVLLTLGQSQRPENVALEDLYRLLTTEDGRNRLDVLEQWMADIDEEVDLIHDVAEQMLEEQYGFFEQEEWSISDLKFQLDRLEAMIQDLKDCVPCP